MSSSAKKTKHPTRQQLSKFLNGELSPKNQSVMEKHLEKCDQCIKQLGEVEGDTLGIRLLEVGTSFENFSAPSNENALSLLRNHDRYELIEPIGAGGMGDVYRARQRSMDRPVAIKVLKQNLFQNDRAVARFHNEIKVAAKLNHPNIVHSYDAEVSNGLNILVMELVEGDKLSDVVRGNGPLSSDNATDIAIQIASGLEYAAGQGMIHRDIKPQNIMLLPDGKVKITDFGLAKFVLAKNENNDRSLTREGEVFGTPDYIAPEQIRNSASADLRSDIYSLGCTLYFVLTGNPPFPDRSVGEKLASHLEHKADSLHDLLPSVDPALVSAIEKMMLKDPAQRFQNYAEVAKALQRVGEDQQSEKEASKAPTSANASISHRTSRRTVSAIVAVSVLSLLGLWFSGIIPGFLSPKAPPNTRTGPIKFAVVVPSRHAFHPEISAIAHSLDNFGEVELEFIAEQAGRVRFSMRKRGATPDRIEAARTLSDLDPSEFDAVIFTGGWHDDSPESTRYAFDPTLNNQAKTFVEQMLADRKPVGSLCGGTVVLANAGLLNGKKAANCRYISNEIKERSGAHWSELPKRDEHATTVTDDLIVTGGNYINAAEVIRVMVKLAENSREIGGS